MDRLSVTLVMKDYDHIAPLACGDVSVEGVDLKLDRDSHGALDRTLGDPSIHAGELSLSRHLLRLAQNDRSFVGIPVFPTRAFRHRCFFVLRGSGLREFRDLEGRRIGTNEWPATGNTWSRAAMREQGVRIDRISWVVGSVDGAPSNRPQGALPSYAQHAPPGRPLVDMLLEGELDALMCPNPPRGFYEPGSPIVRLFPDYRSVEMQYFRRTGLYPAHHIVGVRRRLFEEAPWVVRSLFAALEESKRRWQAQRRLLPETTPWTLAEIEDATALMGQDWQPYGTEPNRAMVQVLCDELFAQGLVDRRLDASLAFAEFDEITSRGTG